MEGRQACTRAQRWLHSTTTAGSTHARNAHARSTRAHSQLQFQLSGPPHLLGVQRGQRAEAGEDGAHGVRVVGQRRNRLLHRHWQRCRQERGARRR